MQGGEFTAGIWPETFTGGGRVAKFSLVETRVGGGATVELHAEGASGLKAVYFELSYDKLKYHPQRVTEATVLGGADEVLRLDILDEPGKVYSGQVLVRCNEKAGFSGDGMLASIRLQPGPGQSLRGVRAAPDSDRSQSVLVYDPASGLSWPYGNQGDYDENSEVNIADLTPLGANFGDTGPFDPASALYLVDGDGNGELNLADITPIGIYYTRLVEGYRAYSSTDLSDYPASNTAPNGPGAVLLDTVTFDQALGAAGERKRFALAVPTPTPGAYYWVRPYEGAEDGTPSTIGTEDPLMGAQLNLYQIDHTLDGTAVPNSGFGHADLTFTGAATPLYFNLAVNGEWVLENVPVLSYAGVGVQQTISASFDLGVADGTDVSSVDAAYRLSTAPLASAPQLKTAVSVGDREVVIDKGRDDPLSAGAAAKETGGEVTDFAAHSSAMPNSDCGKNECVPQAINNSLEWLKTEYGLPIGDNVVPPDPPKPIDTDTIKGVVGTTPTGTPLGWADKKQTYMQANGYPIDTYGVPPTDSATHRVTAGECQDALDALRDGADVELNGQSHCAVIVAMGKLADGRFVIYVAHDTDQGTAGGTIVEKIIYDPAAASAVAEGGWGFNGRMLNGFVVEKPKDPDARFIQIEMLQLNLTSNGLPAIDTGWGAVKLTYTGEDLVLYFNLSYNGTWVIENVPVLSDQGAGSPQSVFMSFDLGVPSGTDVTSGTAAAKLTSAPQITAPAGEGTVAVGDRDTAIADGRPGTAKLPDPKNEDGITVDGDNWAVHDSAFPNQDCGEGECVPAAVSNSLQWLKQQHPGSTLGDGTHPIDIDSAKGAVGWDPTGAPLDWADSKRKAMSDGGYPVNTGTIPVSGDDLGGVVGAADLDKMIQALKDGKDVEMNGEWHCAAVVGAAKLTDGRYVIYVAHDTDQGNPGGQSVDKLFYDPGAADPVLEGAPGFFDGSKLNGFVVESIMDATQRPCSYSLEQIDFLLNGTPDIHSPWGSVVVDYDGESQPLYYNLVIDGTWVIRNVPVLDLNGSGASDSVTMAFPLGVPDGTPVPLAAAASSLSTTVQEIPPADTSTTGVASRQLVFADGRPGTATIPSPTNEDGLDVDDSNWAVHGTPFPNQDCGDGECVPAAVSNSLQWLKQQNPSAPFGDPLHPIDITASKAIVNWIDAATGTPLGWAQHKAQYMQMNGYPIGTISVPNSPDRTDNEATAADLDAIIQALRDGRDVEMNGEWHCAAVVGVARLTDGRYVIYVAHDTDQGHAGGTRIDKVFYNPNDAAPRLEGAPGLFDGSRLNGFVVEGVL